VLARLRVVVGLQRAEVCKMADKSFPAPKYNQLIERDPQIVKVDLDVVEFSARKSAMPSNIKNSMTIKHVS